MMIKYSFDKTLKVGDIVTAYRAGYHRITMIEKRKESGHKINPLVHYQTILDKNGNPTKGKTVRRCDAHYCKRIDEKEINKIHDDGVELFKTLKQNLLDVQPVRPNAIDKEL